MEKRRYIRRMLRMAALAVGMVLTGGASAWGQRNLSDYDINPTYPTDLTQMGQHTEVVYANQGTVSFRLQSDDIPECLDGYIRWYVDNGNGGTTNGLRNTSGFTAEFANGFVWNNRTDAMPGSGQNTISYNYSGRGVVTIVCEASSIHGSAIGNNTRNWTSPLVTIQRKFEIRPASERGQDLVNRRELLNESEANGGMTNSWYSSNFNDLVNCSDEQRSRYFIDNYEIHVPLGQDVTFRLSEKLSNYFVPSGYDGYEEATNVRWTVFKANENRNPTTSHETDGDYMWQTNLVATTGSGYQTRNTVWGNVGLTNDATQTQIFYLVAEVYRGDGNRYPASFIKLYVEPNSMPLTEEQLTSNENQFRTHEDLEKRGYVELAMLDFDEPGDPQEPRAQNNFKANPMSNANSFYAYAYPGYYEDKKGNRLSVGRQEYGLYRTLNMSNVSADRVSIESMNDGSYQDYFAGNGGYDRIVVDKSYANGRGGYFLYLDAADEPGVITKIRLDEKLCNDMQLVVTAWVCDMSSINGGGTNPTPADIGFTFKGVREVGDETTETILNKYYSGGIGRPRNDSGSGGYAKWQQIYYTFNYSTGNEDYNYYILEISNNSYSSNGADYGIDEICVMRSTPRVDVRRMEACDASTLTVNTDYETILANMGWTAGQEVSASASRPAEYAQYGYGLPSDHYGNIYFAFLEGLTEDAEGNITGSKTDATNLDYATAENLTKDIVPRTLPSSGNQYRWVRVNRNLTLPSYQSVYSFRAIITTNENDIPSGTNAQAQALAQEKQYNFQAVLDYNADNNQAWAGDDDTRKGKIDITEDGTITTYGDSNGLITNGTLTKDNITDPRYDEIYTILTEALYSRLQIPRIRCPWFETLNGEEMLFLYEMNVEHTDLMYAGEQYIDENGDIKEASGEYFVMVFSGQQISDYPTPTSVPYSEISDPCALVSSFPVQGSLVIRIDTETESDVLACEGTLRKISAALKNLNTGADLEANYSFDWFFGSLEEYNAITFDGNLDLQGAINYVRNRLGDSFTYEDVVDWTALESGESAIREKLIELMNPESPKIAIDKNNFNWAISSDKIVAMPFVKTDDVDTNLYCTEIQEAPVPLYSIDVPKLHPGYTMTTNPFKGEVSLRLGHPNMDTQMELEIPLQSGFEESMADEAQSLRIPETGGVDISWNNIEEGFPTVGTAQQVTINKGATDAKVTITLSAAAKGYFKEGQRYELRIPFRQYDANNQALDNKCDGVIILPIKVVPEYLTWKGSSSDNWYDESKWNQSTKKDLYFEGWDGTNADRDANGPDDEGNYEDITDAYSPLYFTKITIPESSELALSEPSTTDVNGNTFLNDWVEGDADSIRYEMAVADANGTISPYYINKVDQIYFKPKATLLNQQHLTYDKAWVDFEMTPKTSYWMASPLKEVYAGDMYAPMTTGRQETPAFTDIEYVGENEKTDGKPQLNDRWDPAFYQKAWDKAITYSNDTEGNSTTSVEAVKSNWSIEYNDVTVPYSLGKGFYSRVEKDSQGNALVRLPKKDDEYKYELSTKALTETGKVSADYGKMADGTDITIDLSKVDSENSAEEVDGDGKHFLVGNPYMSYLNMEQFFTTNSNLAKKYWTIDNGTVVVGTPDVTWSSEQTTGYIAPMTAFFIELNSGENVSKEITFSTSMMVAKPADGTDNVYGTRAYTAENPQLTLTASSKQGQSRAAIIQKSDASNQYESDKDAVTLLDSELDAPTVYTVAGNYAAAVNAIHDYKNVPLGVYADASEDVELTIEGASQLVEPLYLYDAVTRSTTPIEGDSYTLNLQGSSHGRYFLTTDEGITVESDIRIYSPADGQLIIASTPSDKLKQVQVYDLSGRVVDSRQNIGLTTCQISVPGGIYIIRAESEHGEAQAKLKVR